MKRVPIVIILTALMVGLFLLFDKCGTNQSPKPDTEQVKNAEQEVKTVDQHFQKVDASFKAHSDSLQKELNETKSKLENVKAKLSQSQTALLKLADKDTGGVSIKERLEDCDSLKAQTAEYVVWVDSVKCIYETNIAQLESLVATKDSQIVICKSSYSQLKDLINENLQRERKLTEDLQTAYKQQRRKTFQNRLLAGGFLILSGITTTLYFNAKK